MALGFIPSDRIILFVSSSLEASRKGADLMMDAVKSMQRKDDVVLVSAGYGSGLPINGIRQLHLGYIQSDDMLATTYSMADAFVIPSREDNLPQTAVEAAACGCPVVGFAVGGIADIVENGVTGYLATAFDTRELAECIEAAAKRRDELSAAARSRTERLFGIQAQSRLYEKLYDELISRTADEDALPRNSRSVLEFSASRKATLAER